MTGRLLTVTEAADILGRSRDFVRGLIDDQVVPHIRHRGRRYVPEHALEAIMGSPATPLGHQPAPVTIHPVTKRGSHAA